MDVRDYMRSKFASSNADPDTFLCPNPNCDDSSGHFKIWVGEGWARGYCVKCSWPEVGDRNLYKVIAQIEGMTLVEVLKKFNLLKDKNRDLLGEGFDQTPVDLNATMAKLDTPIRELKREPAPKPAPAANPGVRATKKPGIIKPSLEAVQTWRSWFPSILKPVSLMGRDALAYLEKRRFSRKHVARHHMRYAEIGEGSSKFMASKFHGRIMLPVFLKGELVFFQGRSILGQEPKYDSPKVFPPDKLRPGMHPWLPAGMSFFGLDRAWGCKRLVIVEGIFDAIRIGDGALALLGKGMTDDRLSLLVELKEAGAEEVLLWLDNDVEAAERNKIFKKIGRILPVRWTTSRLKRKDAAAMREDQVAQTLEEADELSFEEDIGLDD